MELFFLEPIFKEMPWGGNNLETKFGFESDLKNIGEAWCISAHENGDCLIKNGQFKGYKLSELYKEHKYLFGDIKSEKFPLLIKMIDAKEDLSIQVHPDDDYARKNENNSLGKTECWYILDCKENAEIVIGHNAKTKAELKSMIDEQKWDDLINVIPIKKGDFFQINPGIVHAIKGGTMILETQQNSDITYRIYDYGRIVNGKTRELHIEKSLDVIKTPFEMDECKIENFNEDPGIYSCDYYDVWHVIFDGSSTLGNMDIFTNATVVNGEGFVDDLPVKKGDSFIIPANFGDIKIKGNLEFICSNPHE